MKPFSRSDRVGGQIQKELSAILRKEISDPRLETALITAVKMARDLKSARVYFTVGGDETHRERALEAFENAKGYVKRILAGRLGLRYMPQLNFHHDDSFDYGSHIDNILRSLNVNSEDGPDYPTPEKQ